MPDPNPKPTQATPDELAPSYFRGRDVACPGCGYNRRDGLTAACPECRTPIQISDNGAERWLSLSRRRAMFIGVVMLTFSTVYWISYCHSAWEMIETISVDPRSWTRGWWILHYALWMPAVCCLPIAAWHFIRMLRRRPINSTGHADRSGASFHRGILWCVIAIGPWTIFQIGSTIWEHLP